MSQNKSYYNKIAIFISLLAIIISIACTYKAEYYNLILLVNQETRNNYTFKIQLCKYIKQNYLLWLPIGEDFLKYRIYIYSNNELIITHDYTNGEWGYPDMLKDALEDYFYYKEHFGVAVRI